MRSFAQSRSMQMCVVLALAGIMILAGPATAAYSNQGGNQSNQGQSAYGQPQGPGAPEGGSAATNMTRNIPLERHIASQLRSQGYGQTGQIMVLAAGNKVILLGTVPSDSMKNGADKIAKQFSNGATVDNRLHVVKQPKQLSNTQLQTQIGNNLPGDTAKTVHVQAMNGTVTLQGHVKDWAQVADVINTAFAAGAQRVNSRLTVGPAAGGPGGATALATQGNASDLRLAHEVARQLQQQLPPGQNVQTILPQSIYVSVQNGTVTLHGFVRDTSQIQQAGQIARSVQGVHTVTNDLAVFSGQGGTAGQSGNYPPQGYVPGQQSQAGMGNQNQYGGTSGQSSMSRQGQPGSTTGPSGTSSQGQPGTAAAPSGMEAQQQATMTPADLAIARQVVQKLRQELTGIPTVQVMRPNTIYVSAKQGTVTLNGFVRNQNVPQRATQIARSTPGVRSVQSTLKIMGGLAPSYGYVPGQGQPGQQGQPGAGTSGPGTSAGNAQFSQTAYSGRSNMGEENTGAGPMGGQYGAGTMAAPSLPPMGITPADTALAWQVAQKLQQQLPDQWVQVVRPNTIYVVANQGTIMLYGFVTNPNVKQHANQVAQSVTGVQHVSNSLGVMGAGAPPALGYIPGQENQPENQQFRNESGTGGYSDEESGNQEGW